jgi:hypothetical protein
MNNKKSSNKSLRENKCFHIIMIFKPPSKGNVRFLQDFGSKLYNGITKEASKTLVN